MHTSKGMAATITVMVLSVVVLLIMTTVSLTSIGGGQAALGLTKGENARYITESCLEDALNSIRKSSSYAGGTITLPEGACTVTVGKSGTTYTITATTTATDYKKTIEVVAVRGGKIVITSWKEL